MPSKEYLEMLAKENENMEPSEPIVLTKKDKVKDFWFYYRMMFIGGGLAIVLVVALVYDIVTTVHPDYQIAILTGNYLPSETLDALEKDLTAFAEDINDDGEVVVQVNYYQQAFPTTEEESNSIDPTMQQAAVTRMAADLSGMSSVIFITDTAEAAQTYYEDIFIEPYSDNVPTTEGVVLADSNLVLDETHAFPEDNLGKVSYEYIYENYEMFVRVPRDDKAEEYAINMAMYDALTTEK